MAKMIHSMIRVLDVANSVQFYHALFDLKVCRRLDFNEFSLIYLGNDKSDFELELTHNLDQVTPYKHGNGYGHMAFSTPHIETLHQRAHQLGYHPKEIKSFYNCSTLVAKFFFIKDPDGYDIEVIQQSDNY